VKTGDNLKIVRHTPNAIELFGNVFRRLPGGFGINLSAGHYLSVCGLDINLPAFNPGIGKQCNLAFCREPRATYGGFVGRAKRVRRSCDEYPADNESRDIFPFLTYYGVTSGSCLVKIAQV
jgi:hypothetical protein